MSAALRFLNREDTDKCIVTITWSVELSVLFPSVYDEILKEVEHNISQMESNI